MELAIWRWSTGMQMGSLLIITVFFAVLSRSVRLAELRYWLRAWACNLAALIVTLLFWYLQPGDEIAPLVRAAYVAPKTAFVLLLIRGGWASRQPGSRLLARAPVVAGLAVYVACVALLPRSLDLLGAVQHSAMALLFGAGALLLGRPPAGGVGWLAAGMGARALLSAVEAAAYVSQLGWQQALGPGLQRQVAVFLAAHSSFDNGVEWLLALGCVLALSERSQRELLRSHAELLVAQEDLRRLADRDPLTALANRRSLPEVFRAVQPKGATLLFFDLDGFKQLNDLHGHRAGDEVLKRFAAALGESFRPSDAVVRYAGDEFLVVASGLDQAAIDGRLAGLRERVERASGGRPIRFSVGVAELAPGGRPEAALEAADQAMYRAKTLAPRAG